MPLHNSRLPETKQEVYVKKDKNHLEFGQCELQNLYFFKSSMFKLKKNSDHFIILWSGALKTRYILSLLGSQIFKVASRIQFSSILYM